MTLRASTFTAFAALLLISLAAPVGAASLSAQKAQLYARIRAIKRAMNMEEGQQQIARGWKAAHPLRKKMPRGMRGIRIHPEREHEPGTLDREQAREQMARAGSLAAQHAAQASSGPTTSAFGTNQRVNNPAGDVFPDAGQSETAVAANGNNFLVTWNDGDGFDRTTPNDQLLGYGYSTNGGSTWTDGGQLPQGVGHPLWQWSSDPVLVVNETTGEFIFAGLVFPDGPPGVGSTNGVAIVKGTFSGGTFSWGNPTLVISGNNATTFFDKEWLAVDPANGNLYVSYTKFTLTGDEIDFTRSTNGGTLWTSPVKLSPTADDGYVQGSRVAVGPSSEVYVVWQTIGLVDKDYFRLKKSTNFGASFSAEVQAADYFSNFSSGAPGFNRERGITYPGITVDRTTGPDRGRLYVTWNECVNYFTTDLDSPSTGNVSEPEPANVAGQNDNATRAVSFVPGNTVRGTISNINTDLDFFKFSATQGQTYVFFVDSLSSTIDMAFRLLCSDSTTRLAISSPGQGLNNLIVWTCPVSGTYYIRPAAWPQTSDNVQHPYRIHTSVHVNPGSDRARDHRDIFVASSSNGLTWPISGVGVPTRVNDDPIGFDNWLPEVAVTGSSHVFCTWYDWRDSAPLRCGGESSLYLYRSDNAGQTWLNLGLITDAKTSWTTVQSNVAPNQGDYIALFANQGSVIPSWGDGRDGNPNVYIQPILATTPTLASLASSRVESDRVELDWLATEYSGQSAGLERRDVSGGWSEIAREVVGSDGRVAFVDRAVTAGSTYGYRLAFGGGGSVVYSSESEIVVPGGLELALRSPQPNPAVRALWIGFTLPSAAPATLSVLDVAGRLVASREVGSLGAGAHRVNLAEGRDLPTGVYIVRLQQGGRTLTTRASLVR